MWEFLSKTGCYIEKTDTIITRCPFCGDSRRKLVNYGHLYLSKVYPFFICFRCNTKGHIKKLLSKFVELGLTTVENAKKILSYYGGQHVNFRYVESNKLVYDSLTNNKFTKQQVDYLKERIGKSLDWNAYKIVSPSELLENSNFLSINSPIIKQLKQNLDALKYFSENYVGFISLLDTVMIFRHVYPSEPRYIQIYTDNHDSYDIFVNKPNMTPYKLYKFKQFVIAEGVFDILNSRVSLNINDEILGMAVFGKSRLGKGLSILRSFFVEPEKIYIYLDQDVLKDKFQLFILKRIYSETCCSLLFNDNGKDFGEKHVLIKEVR